MGASKELEYHIYIYTRHPETPRKGTLLKKRYLFPSIARIVLLAEESCLEAGGLFLARIYQLRSHFGFSKFLPRQLLRCRCARSCEHLGRCCKLLGRYCSKLRPFLPFGIIRSSHPDDLPALGGKDGWLP